MKLSYLLYAGILSSTLYGQGSSVESHEDTHRHWVCDGYCFLGGDVPVNPFQPVSSSGATEEEARENIDCGPYQETGIVCKEVADR